MRFSKFGFPLFAFGYAVAIVAATATYSVDSRADFSLSVVGCSSFALSGNVLTCNPTPQSGVGTCSIGVTTAPSPMTSAGGTVALSANCTTTMTSFAWTKGSSSLGTASTASDTLPANTGTSSVSYTYGLTACNASSQCAPATSTTVFVPAAGGTPIPPGTISCAGFNKTLNINLPWIGTATTGRVLTSSFGGFGANDAMVVQLHPPAGVLSSANGNIALYEWGGGPIARLSVISTTPCDFSTANAATLFNASKGSDPRFWLQVGGTQTPGIVLLQPGVTYYLNVKNSGCPTGTKCEMGMDFAKPAGT